MTRLDELKNIVVQGNGVVRKVYKKMPTKREKLLSRTTASWNAPIGFQSTKSFSTSKGRAQARTLRKSDKAVCKAMFTPIKQHKI